MRNPYIINDLEAQFDIQDRRMVYQILENAGIEIPRYAILDRDDSERNCLIEQDDHVEVNGIVFNKPFVEKPVSAEDHNIYVYYPSSAGGGSQRLFRKIGSRSSFYSSESTIRKTGSYIYEDFMPTDGTDVKGLYIFDYVSKIVSNVQVRSCSVLGFSNFLYQWFYWETGL